MPFQRRPSRSLGGEAASSWRARLILARGRGDDGAPALAQVRRERNPKTGRLLIYSKRFYHLGVSGLKMALYCDLSKDDPKSPGYVSFPTGWTWAFRLASGGFRWRASSVR
jgi:hypothetical protein